MLRKQTLKCFFVALLMILWVGGLTRPVWAERVVTPGAPIVPAEQQVLIFYDPVKKQETLVFSPAYRFREQKFVWIVPVPATPSVGTGHQFVFENLKARVAPDIEVKIRRHWKVSSFLLDLIKRLTAPPKSDDPFANLKPGQVIVSRRNANQTVRVIAPGEKDKFLNICRENFEDPDYTPPADLVEWMKPYEEQKFSFVAISASADLVDQNSAADEQVLMTPFRITFPAEKPFVPMIRPASAVPNGWRPYNVFRYFVVMPERAEVRVGDQPFFDQTHLVYANRVSREDWNTKIWPGLRMTTVQPTEPAPVPPKPEAASKTGKSPAQPEPKPESKPATTPPSSTPSSTPPPAEEAPVGNDLFLTAYARADQQLTPITQDGTIVPAATQATFKLPTKVEFEDRDVSFPIEGPLLVIAGIAVYLRQRRQVNS
ncbi:MAG: DUF2330 domain-containing protein [Acidobacteria bacterium]|nr:DUF2330 domain-containing protein [Acidobacteriota bacterium]